MFSFVWVLKFINLTLRSLLQTKLQEQATQKQHTSHRSNDHDDTHCQVTGEEKRGRMHMLGLGPSPADLLGQKLSRSSHTKMALETKGSPNEKVSKMSNKMEAMEQKFASLEAQIGRMTSHLQNLKKFAMKKILRRCLNISFTFAVRLKFLASKFNCFSNLLQLSIRFCVLCNYPPIHALYKIKKTPLPFHCTFDSF